MPEGYPSSLCKSPRKLQAWTLIPMAFSHQPGAVLMQSVSEHPYSHSLVVLSPQRMTSLLPRTSSLSIRAGALASTSRPLSFWTLSFS